MSFEVRGADGVHKMLQQWTDPKLSKRLQTATKDGATVMKAPLKAEAARVSKRLARSVSVRQAKRDKPATIITFRPKVAFFRHFIVGGTRDHGPRKAPFLRFIPNWNQYFPGGPPQGASSIRSLHVRGVRPNPIPVRVAQAMSNAVYTAIDRSLDKDI